MKKCKFCDHYGCTNRGEEVCTKLLLFVGDNKEELPCNDFSFRFDTKHVFVAILVMILVLLVIISCI